MISPEPPRFRLAALPLRRTGARVRRALPRQPQSVRRVLSAPPAVAGRCFRSAEAAGLRKGRQEFFEKGRRPPRRAVFGAFVSACAFGGGRGAQAFFRRLRASEKTAGDIPAVSLSSAAARSDSLRGGRGPRRAFSRSRCRRCARSPSRFLRGRRGIPARR